VFLDGTSRNLSSDNFRIFGSALKVDENSSNSDISTANIIPRAKSVSLWKQC